MEIKASSLDDILADVHYYIGKLTKDKEIMHSDYLVSYKSEKAAGVGAQLADVQDYKKFLLDYKKLSETKKNMTMIDVRMGFRTPYRVTEDGIYRM